MDQVAPAAQRGAVVWGAVGVLGLAGAWLAPPRVALDALHQDWPPFVLVAGLLLVGLAADEDRLFAWLGGHVAGVSTSGARVYVVSASLVVVVTALLNLDTAVVFMTPLMIHVARRRGVEGGAWLYGPVLLANAGSLWLPGSNLTNLIVVGPLHLTGARFLARLGGPALAASVVAVALLASRARRAAGTGRPAPEPVELRVGAGTIAVVAATTTMLVTPDPALPVLAIGAAAVGWRVVRGRDSATRVLGALAPASLFGLFGAAVLLGTVGRDWAEPARLVAHLSGPATVAVAAVAAVLANNLPAASMLAAHLPAHPLAALIGLNLGPNLAPTGSLAWLLWLRAARGAGGEPSLRVALRWGWPIAVATLVVATLWLEVAGLR
ncbi:MAG: SLC13 family permease [Acidimicrobiales bacterium]